MDTTGLTIRGPQVNLSGYHRINGVRKKNKYWLKRFSLLFFALLLKDLTSPGLTKSVVSKKSEKEKSLAELLPAPVHTEAITVMKGYKQTLLHFKVLQT